MKKILGLDLGTNSIGWALIEIDHEKQSLTIQGLGSRILPMDAGEIAKFDNGAKIISAAAQRTEKRGARRVNERFLLRRNRLHLVLNILQALPEHYKIEVDFKNQSGEKSGKFKKDKEPKIAYLPKAQNKKAEFLFKESYLEMLQELGIEDKKHSRIPYDWTLYYLRQKALNHKISLEEFAWVLLSYNQKRGYEKLEVESKSTKENEIVEELDLRVKHVEQLKDKTGKTYFRVTLDDNYATSYNEYSDIQLSFENDIKEVKITSLVDEKGNIDNTKTIITVIDIYSLSISEVIHETENNKHLYHLTYNNGWKQTKRKDKFTNQFELAKNKNYDYVVETVYDSAGNIKTVQGLERKLREPDFSDNSNDWTLLKKKTEKEALAYNLKVFKKPEKFISPKIYSVLKNDAISGSRTKIIGGMFQTVDRSFYRAELNRIIETQRGYHKALSDQNIFEECVKLLYPNNPKHARKLLENKDAIQHLLIEDILLYQRPLKTKKSEIADCKFEIKYSKNALNDKGNPIEIVNKSTGEVSYKQEIIRHKAVSVSHPYYQEFRIWDKLHNLKIIQLERLENGKIKTNVDVTSEILTEEVYHQLFEKLNNQKSLSYTGFMKLMAPYFKAKKWDEKNIVWNFTEDDEIKGNTTRVDFAVRFIRCGFSDYINFLTQAKEYELWHYLYSVPYKERIENNFKSVRSFLENTFFKDYTIDKEVVERLVQDFANFPKFESKYGAYSEKALKKLLPLMQLSNRRNYDWVNSTSYQKYWDKLNIRKNEILSRLNKIDFNADNIDYSTIIDNDVTPPFPKGLFNAFKDVADIKDFQNLNLTKASYLIYGRHSELEQAKYWHSPEQIREELHQELKQHSLNNPVAEKVLLEMMQVVADIWDYYGEGADDFFSEIHVEVGRELKKSAKEKLNDSRRNSENKVQNDRLRQILEEFLGTKEYKAIAKNIDHFERLKIVEDGASHTKNTVKDFFSDKSYTKKEIEEILKKSRITKEDFEKYKLWIEQGYKSPYTNKIIRLTDLFDGNKYNVDHILPRALVTNDSLSNKVVCEKEINQEKSKQTARDFILNPTKKEIYCAAHGGTVPIISDDDYTDLVKKQFSGTKRYILLSKDVPKEFTSSQLNNSRHIARKAMELLSHVVREEGEVEFLSKNVIPVTGEITSKLKKAWKLDQVWKKLMAPRFIRMNELTNSELFGKWQKDKNGNEYFDCNLDEIIREKNPNFDIKRIDHRHHALDALIIALCTRDHVNYINNINADAKGKTLGEQKKIEKYRETLKKKILFSKPNKDNPSDKDWFYINPGCIRIEDSEISTIDSVNKINYKSYNKDYGTELNHFDDLVYDVLKNVITSYKASKSPIRKTSNKYQSYKKENGELNLVNGIPKKGILKQKTDANHKRNIAIRKSMHDEIPYAQKFYDYELKSIESAIKKFEDFDKVYDENLKTKLIDLYYSSNEDFKEFKSALKKDKDINDKAFFWLDSPIKLSVSRKSIVGLNEKQIEKIVNPEIYQDLLLHIKQYDSIEEAMSASGIEQFNSNRKIPIHKVTLGESGEGRYVLGKTKLKEKQGKMVKGTNYSLFIDRENNTAETISLKSLIENNNTVINNENSFNLVPNDIVKVQSENNVDADNLYQFVNSTGDTANFAPVNIANPIWDFGFPSAKKEEKEYITMLLEKGNFNSDKKDKFLKNEIGLGSKQNKHTRTFVFDLQNRITVFNGLTIRDNCIKLKIDRLGNISKA